MLTKRFYVKQDGGVGMYNWTIYDRARKFNGEDYLVESELSENAAKNWAKRSNQSLMDFADTLS